MVEIELNAGETFAAKQMLEVLKRSKAYEEKFLQAIAAEKKKAQAHVKEWVMAVLKDHDYKVIATHFEADDLAADIVNGADGGTRLRIRSKG